MAAAILQTIAAQGFGPSQTASSWTLNADDSNGIATYSYRVAFLAIAFGGKQIRATFNSAAASAVVCTHASAAIAATAPSTVNTPVEFKFNKVSGFSLSAGGSIVSDWLDFDLKTTDTLIIDIDMTTTNVRVLNPASNVNTYIKAGATDWQTATVSGYTNIGNRAECINLLEVRA